MIFFTLNSQAKNPFQYTPKPTQTHTYAFIIIAKNDSRWSCRHAARLCTAAQRSYRLRTG